MSNRNWVKYYGETKNISPRKSLVEALSNFDKEDNMRSKYAVDLGSGSGADTIELLKRDWHVLAIDSQQAAISTLLSATHQLLINDKLKTKLSSFESLTVLPSVNLINASFSLPFLRPDHFYKFWDIILKSLQPGARFSGSFFGIHDDWNNRSDMTIFKRQAIFDLFNQFKIEYFEEKENTESNALGFVKHWHTYLIVAKKINYHNDIDRYSAISS